MTSFLATRAANEARYRCGSEGCRMGMSGHSATTTNDLPWRRAVSRLQMAPAMASVPASALSSSRSRRLIPASSMPSSSRSSASRRAPSASRFARLTTFFDPHRATILVSCTHRQTKMHATSDVNRSRTAAWCEAAVPEAKAVVVAGAPRRRHQLVPNEQGSGTAASGRSPPGRGHGAPEDAPSNEGLATAPEPSIGRGTASAGRRSRCS